MSTKIQAQVTRGDAPGMNFGVDDRSVLVVLHPDEPRIENALIVEEYIIEQLAFEVVGEFVVVDDPRMVPDLRSYKLDESLDIPFEGREPDGIEPIPWGDFVERQNAAARGIA